MKPTLTLLALALAVSAITTLAGCADPTRYPERGPIYLDLNITPGVHCVAGYNNRCM